MKNLHFYGGTGKLNNVNIDAKQEAYLETYPLLQWEPFIILTKKRINHWLKINSTDTNV